MQNICKKSVCPFINKLVFCARLERATLWLKVKCSTYWANRTVILVAPEGFEPSDVRVKVWCLTTWLRGIEMVERHRFELWNPKEQIYSLPRLTTSLPLHLHGADRETRTPNLLITSQLRYQLRYVGFKWWAM